MYRFLIKILLLIGTTISCQSYAGVIAGDYANIIEKILFFKKDKFKVFYGGPIDNEQNGIRWMMPALFEDDFYKTRAACEISFINCDINNAEDAEVLFLAVSDIDIKFQNTLSDDFKIFSDLINGKYKDEKYIIVRSSDASIAFYPDIFYSFSNHLTENDKEEIVNFLHQNLKTKNTFNQYHSGKIYNEILFENDEEIVFKTIPLSINVNGKNESFSLMKRILKNDPWKLYYIVSKGQIDLKEIQSEEPVLIRIDSGCLSGQIYNDEACDCLDQLHSSLCQLLQDDNEYSLVIHIPAHDGRGFGSAPKAETEIYKRGGKGRVCHVPTPLNTIAAAELLYGSKDIDLRTFDGAAQILKKMNIKKVFLLTDNVTKVKSLEDNGIEVIRKKTGTTKHSCQQHIDSKKESSAYYKD